MPNGAVDTQKFNDLINAKGTSFAYRFKMDKSNYKEAPFCQIDESL